MRRLHLLVAGVIVGLLVAMSSAALAAPANVLPFTWDLECGDAEPVTTVWNGRSWVFHSEDGTARFVAFYVHPEDMEDPLLDRAADARGAPMTTCTTLCPVAGPTTLRGIWTPVGPR
jgi:hypothetical protein